MDKSNSRPRSINGQEINWGQKVCQYLARPTQNLWRTTFINHHLWSCSQLDRICQPTNFGSVRFWLKILCKNLKSSTVCTGWRVNDMLYFFGVHTSMESCSKNNILCSKTVKQFYIVHSTMEVCTNTSIIHRLPWTDRTVNDAVSLRRNTQYFINGDPQERVFKLVRPYFTWYTWTHALEGPHISMCRKAYLKAK